MGVHRTREQKIRAKQRRELRYTWEGDATTSAPVHEGREKKLPPADPALAWLKMDLLRTLVASMVIVGLLIAAWFLWSRPGLLHF